MLNYSVEKPNFGKTPLSESVGLSAPLPKPHCASDMEKRGAQKPRPPWLLWNSSEQGPQQGGM